LEARAVAAEKRTTNNDSRASLEATITAAELYMQALRLTDNAAEKRRLDAKTKELIAKAERLKKLGDNEGQSARSAGRSRAQPPLSTRKLTTRENIILLEGSKLNGAVFKPWTTPPAIDEFLLKDGQELWTDDFEYSLCETQLKHFDGWQRPHEALSRINVDRHVEPFQNEVTMDKFGSWDMVQDAAPDCSVVASLCAGGARAEKGHRKASTTLAEYQSLPNIPQLFATILYPYDQQHEHPDVSPNGRYILRFYFNGCWRRVEVDDRLPTSKSPRILHIVDRSNPGRIWPTIVEKAYLKVRGGYDFPGSNSGTDLAVLTGWIPQQIFLHDEDVEPQTLWEELYAAFVKGEIMCTLGTGKLGRREQQLLGLGAEHDYAVLDMEQTGDISELLIKNPWANGDVWKGAARRRPHPGQEDDTAQPPVDEMEREQMKPGTFWMDFNHVFQYFENMYVNWDPCLFTYREDMHFTWHLPEIVQAGNLFVDHPQFAVKAKRAGEVWILLNRHFRTGDFSVQNNGKNGYISLYLFNKSGGRVFSSENAKVQGPFVDSPNTLLRFQTQAHETYTLVAVSQDLPTGKHNFTLSTFSNSLVEISGAYQTYRDPQVVKAAWTRATAGGSSNSAQYLQNPQFTLRVDGETRAALVLRVLSDGSNTKPNTDVHVKVLVASSDGRRITKLRQRDIVAHSGDYKRGSAVIETTLHRGTYTLVCSTFEQGQLSKFQLDLHTTLDIPLPTIKALPAEGSGRLSILALPAVFTNSVCKLIASVTIGRVTKALWKASLSSGSRSDMFKMSLEQNQGPYRQCIVSSSADDEEYNPIANGLRIEDIDLSTNMSSAQSGGLWLVIERPGQSSTQTKDTTVLQVEVLSEERIEIGEWAPLED